MRFFIYGIAGFFVRISGKISVTGNARKRRLIFKCGKSSFHNFAIRVSNDFYLVKTKTGCLGIVLNLFYY